MRGLIRNNFYSVGSTLKWTIAFCICVNVAVLIGMTRFPNIDGYLPILMLGQIGAFTGMTATALQKDNTSKWCKYERTLPVKMSDVVMARYISFLIFSAIGIVLASITVLIFAVVSDSPISLEKVGFGYSFGIGFGLLLPAILYPLVLKFGADKSELMLMISLIIAVILNVAGSAMLTACLDGLNSADMIYRIAYSSICMVLFIMSYFVSYAIYKRKESFI